jgi:phospholipid/cholesterol/gamma-HCH transport system substrate-binding protein
MSEQARNFRVGLFVLAGAFAIGTCAVMLGGGGLFATRIRFESYFNEAVTGLEVGSAVRYRGVRIGVVKSIGLVENYYEFPDEESRLKHGQAVSILMEYVIARPEDADLRDLSYEEHRARLQGLVKRGLRLRIAQIGVTGTSFVQADLLDPATSPPMELTWEPRHIYIPSAPSTIATLTSAAERFAAKVEQVDINRIADSLDRLLANLAEATDALDVREIQDQAALLMRELRETNRQMAEDLAAADVPGIGAGANRAMEEATATMVRARRILDGGRYDLELALENMRVATENLRDLTEILKAQPSLMFRGEAPEVRPVEVGP